MAGFTAFLLAFFIVNLCLYDGVWALTGPQIAQDLKKSLSAGSEVFLPSDPAYANQTTARWEITAAPTYVVAVKPDSIVDVQKIVKYAAKNNVSFLATGAGHGYTNTLSALHNGLSLDLGNFSTIEIDSAANTVKIGGSVRAARLIAALQDAGKEMPVGQCTCIGMTGFSLGGGIGPYSGLYGTASDSVAEIEMVTGAGEILTVSQSQHPDLFWGMKGAGFNYGVVTAITYNIYNATNGGQALNADMTFPGSQNGSVWELARSFVGNHPKELAITFSIQYNATLGEMAIVGNFIYAGPLENLTALIQPFLDLQPAALNISSVPWKDVASSALYGATNQGCAGTGVEYVPYAVNLYQIDVPSMVAVVNFMNKTMAATPDVQTAVVALAQYAPSGFQLHADASSAFPYRDAVIFAQIDGFAFSATPVPALTAFGASVRDLLHKGSGKTELQTYVHFAHGDEGEAAWYTEGKLRSLKALKAVYDPRGLFSFYNAVGRRGGNYTTR
ncbi:FAD-linked oxidoreductase [Lachnellula occidentalis]|uniref:FAD-linked oxidoreductase n=1 Tax=Lachnellula occidentalis TaxID=215460 RepID=A0A8H8RVR0_9HELO|nr:FAD-linked oxidoreductase [Lachnellula occidentalis]